MAAVTRMRFHLISCEVFSREAEAVIARSPHEVHAHFLSKGLHNIGCAAMCRRIQQALDKIDQPADAILLGYGLCNNGLVGLKSGWVPLVIPRAHDCITLLLGSRQRYSEYFEKQPGTYFRSTGWLEHEKNPEELDQLSIARRHGLHASYEELVARYGVENARYLWEELVNHARHYCRLAFIQMGVEPDETFEHRAQAEAARRGWEFEKLQGDLSLLERLVCGVWPDSEFLVVPPRHRVVASYDDQIVTAETL